MNAVGDIANHLHPVFGRLRVEHYNNAEKQGQAAARSMLGDPRPYDYIHSFWSDQYDQSIEYVGFAKSWDEVVLRGSIEERKFLVFYLSEGVMKADGELRACQALIQARTRLAKAVLADDSIDLRSLAGA
jgi:3-phenylpropionate/trans-cinnamate dioxygenase ferredoxin reductase subunit